MTTRKDLEKTAASVFGFTSLRNGQLEAMEAAVQGRDVLCVMPTGHGKSAIYQVPAMAVEGVAVVVSPLIALQRDQASAINAAAGMEANNGGVTAGDRAYVLNSAETEADTAEAWAAAEDPDEQRRAKFLFLAPEQLVREEVATRVAALDVSFLVIDEAHCVSAWGHGFRPDYLQLGRFARKLHRPVIALTATASAPVRREITEQLRLSDPLVIAQGFDRPNLRLEVVHHAAGPDKERAVSELLPELAGPGLLYVATRRETESYARMLRGRGLKAEAYHSGRRAGDREDIHARFLDDELDVVVATTAFGMGIDKPNVRFVVHGDVPDSVDSYYQEIGRAGRDGEPALAVLHYRSEDLGIRRYFAAKQPDEQALRELLAALDGGSTTTADLRRATGFSTRRVTGLANLLQAAGALRAVDGGYRARSGEREKAVAAAVEHARAREAMDQSRVDMMRQYTETGQCRRQFLLGYFGEELEKPCGNCDTCSRGTAEPDPASRADPAGQPFPLESAVNHPSWGAGMVMSYEAETVTVLFESEGYKTLSLALVEEKGLLHAAEVER
jgi:ATP-dependent DNA helicase RecQ